MLGHDLISVRQRLEWVGVADADRAKVPHVGGEQDKVVSLRGRRDSDVGKSGI